MKIHFFKNIPGSDPEKLRLLADWFDNKYGENGGEVQDDLRRIALQLEKLFDTLEDMCG